LSVFGASTLLAVQLLRHAPALSTTEPAPAMSNSGLLIAAALLGAAGTVLVRRRKRGS